MKHLKTTIKLSVLALACLGAGALALQPTASVKAEDSAACLSMEGGASVCVKDGFSGIRWTTKVDFAKYQSLCGAGKTIQLGSLVLPTSMLGDDGVLTDADAGALDIPANLNANNIASDTEYYTIVNYDNLADAYEGTLSEEEALKKAYSMELTVRSYVKVNGTYYFADEMGDSRSASQVALTAELSGDWGEDENDKAVKAAKYYGMTSRYTPDVVSNGAAGTAVINLNFGDTPAQDVIVENIQLDGNVEPSAISAFIGAERVNVKRYAASTKKLTLEIEAGQNFPTGEAYLTVFTNEGLYSLPIIGATMVFDELSDFNYFAQIRENTKPTSDGKAMKVSSTPKDDTVDMSKYKFDGYYVLTQDLTAAADGSEIAEDAEGITVGGWFGTSNFVGTGLGLTGTFNGLGHTITGYEDSRTNSGLFQLVNGGTIKNLGVVDFTPFNGSKSAYCFAHYMIDPVLENVYVKSNEKLTYTGGQYILGSYLYQTEANAAKLNNVFVDAVYAGKDSSGSSTAGGLFGNYTGVTEYNFSNVYSVCNMGLYYKTSKTSKLAYDYTNTDGSISGKNIYTPNVLAYGDNQKLSDTVYYVDDPNYANAQITVTVTGKKTNTATFTHKDVKYDFYLRGEQQEDGTYAKEAVPFITAYYLRGAYSYHDMDDFVAATKNLASFSGGLTGGNCWTVGSDGTLTWGIL